MAILIKGMEMPKSYKDIRIYADGRIVSKSLHTYGEEIATAVPIPEHGRLIDADALTISTAVPLDEKPYQYVHIDNIKAAPTIIPASKEGKT